MVHRHSPYLILKAEWWAKAVALAAPSTPVVANASTQTELLRGEAAVQTSDFWKCLGLSLGQGQAADLVGFFNSSAS